MKKFIIGLDEKAFGRLKSRGSDPKKELARIVAVSLTSSVIETNRLLDATCLYDEEDFGDPDGADYELTIGEVMGDKVGILSKELPGDKKSTGKKPRSEKTKKPHLTVLR
jgi:hypothetical protein